MSNIPIKTAEEIATMHAAGKIARKILTEVLSLAKPAVTTLELENHAVALLKEHNVTGAFHGYEGYQHNLVTCINDEVVHGIPSERQLELNDILTIDFGVILDGYYSDVAETILVGETTQTSRKDFLIKGKDTLTKAIQVCKPGNRIGDISHVIQTEIENAGYNVIRMFVGHGLGTELHEPPQIPGYGEPNTGPMLDAGMVLAVEVMYTMGGYEVEVLDDGWTAVTKDHSLSSMFENTVAITEDTPLILTQL